MTDFVPIMKAIGSNIALKKICQNLERSMLQKI